MFYRQVWLVWGISFILLLVCNSVEQSTLPRDSYKEPDSIKINGQEEQPEMLYVDSGPMKARNGINTMSARKTGFMSFLKNFLLRRKGTTRKEDKTEKKVSILGGKDENEILQSAQNYGPVFLDLGNNTDNSSERKRDDINSDIRDKKRKGENAGKNKKVKDGKKRKNKKGKDGKKGKGTTRKEDKTEKKVPILGVDAAQIPESNVSVLGVDAAQIPESNVSVLGVDAAQPPESNVSVHGVDAAQLPASNVSVLGVDAAQLPESNLSIVVPSRRHAAGRYLAAALRSEIASAEPSETRFREDMSAKYTT